VDYRIEIQRVATQRIKIHIHLWAHVMENKFDVIIVGAGHAGIEAAHIAAKMGAKTALITIDEHKVGVMPCNPSVGGLGKGHIVYEVSALGGLMPKLCSQSYLQAR